MRLRAACGSALEAESDCMVLTLFEGEKISEGIVGRVDGALKGAISGLVRDGEFRGEPNQVSVLHTLGEIPAKTVAVVGLGKHSDISLDGMRQAAGTALKRAREIGSKRVSSQLPRVEVGGAGGGDLAQAFVEGGVLGLYRFGGYKGEKERREVEEITIFEPDQVRTKESQEGVERGEGLAAAQNMVRDLVNEPSNSMTPSVLAGKAAELAADCGLDLRVLERADMEELGMGGLLGVARGSEEPPKLIVLRYERGKDLPLIALVGKGVTFDSGGLSLKSPDKMPSMKGDMAGGAAVLGAMRAISQLKPEVNVAGLIPATENMPSGHALKPGDVIRCFNGKTVEIISTDAEGRLILADALAYATELGASKVFDIATLTGGCVVALGRLYSALLGNDQASVDLVLDLSRRTGEKFWQLPLAQEYKEQLRSEVADIKNSGGREASTITAGLFLEEFVNGTPWVHIDIAGKELTDKDIGYAVKGASGVAMRTLVELVCELARIP